MKPVSLHPLTYFFRAILLRFKIIGFVLILCAGIFVFWSYSAVENSAAGKIFSRLEDVPQHDVGLLLGAAVTNGDGDTNYYMRFRIDAAVALFRAGKIRHILVSGDNHTASYNEPGDIRNVLIQRGIPETCITLDYAGFSTFDSMIRCRDVFGQKKVLVISQDFHNRRALYIAANSGIDACAFSARDLRYNGRKQKHLREYMARAVAVLDLFVFHSRPHFLGKKEKIVIGC